MLSSFCDSYGLNALCLRYLNVYGPKQVGEFHSGVIMRFINQFKQGKQPIICSYGKQTRGFVHVADVVGASVLALDGSRGIWGIIDLGSGRSTTINTLADFNGAKRKKQFRPIYAALKREVSKIAVLT